MLCLATHSFSQTKMPPARHCYPCDMVFSMIEKGRHLHPGDATTHRANLDESHGNSLPNLPPGDTGRVTWLDFAGPWSACVDMRFRKQETREMNPAKSWQTCWLSELIERRLLRVPKKEGSSKASALPLPLPAATRCRCLATALGAGRKASDRSAQVLMLTPDK